MFGMDKKMKEAKENPEKALEDSQKKVNSGMTGFMTKAFMGKEFTNDMNKGFEAAHEGLEMQKQYQNPDATGLPATAEILSVEDSGQMVNFNPVLILQLKVNPQYEPPFETTAKTIVSKIAIPRVGDTINIKYAPADKTKISIV
jgi:hypothetical protein